MNKNISSNNKPRQRKGKRTKLWSVVRFLQIAILLGISASVGISLGMFVNLSKMLPKIETITMPEASIIYSSDGEMLARVFREDRTSVTLDNIPKHLRDATIAIEDSRFYQHSGVDMRGIARAIWQNIRGHRLAQGGSTITQQLARNVFLSQKKTMDRKAKEAVLAILIERKFPKDKILELYLNRIYYGSGAFGVEAASKVYFGKSVDQLDLSESAMLAGLPQKPSGYSPHEDLPDALIRRDIVLNRMAQLGYITNSERDKAKSETPYITRKSPGRTGYKAPNFVDYVIKQLRSRYGDDFLYNGGLRIYTTLNWEMQKAAEKALRDGVRKHEKLRKVSEGCFVCLEPGNGYVRAMVGSVDPVSQFNRCTQGQGRQPGSAFKVFVYTAALQDDGMTPSDRIKDAPVSYPGANGKDWKPKNYDNKYHGWVTLKTAVAQSINIPAIKVAEKVGINNVIKYAQLMGIKSELEPYLSTAIGGVKGVHPLEIASAYCTFANDGVYVEPCSIIRIENNKHEVIDDSQPKGKRVITKETNAMMDEMLRAVVADSRGTGKNARQIHNARGKTGTTNDDRDAWFVGYVPNKLVAACWVGNDNNSPMRKAFGGAVCAPIWSEFMGKAIPVYDHIVKVKQNGNNSVEVINPDKSKDNKTVKKAKDRSQDSTIEVVDDQVNCKVCDESGELASKSCPATHTAAFQKGTEPTTICSIHSPAISATDETAKPVEKKDETMVEATICPDSYMLAGSGCPKKKKVRMNINDVPTQVCNLHNREPER